jgi:hypothetical protein
MLLDSSISCRTISTLYFPLFEQENQQQTISIREVAKVSKAFSNLLKYIDKLPHTKKEQVYQWVKRYVEPASFVSGRLISEMRETRFKEGFECPHCASEHVVRFGKYKGRQRYRRKCCEKTFNDTTNTFLYRSRKGNEWIIFVYSNIE